MGAILRFFIVSVCSLAACSSASEDTEVTAFQPAAIVLEPRPILGLNNDATAGLSLVDYNDDGWLDLTVADIDDGVLLFLGGPDGFIPDTERLSGVESTRGSRAVVWVDVDDDGDLDLLVTRRDENPVSPLLLRAEAGKLVDATEAYGLNVPGGWEGAAFGDLDGDGDLDLLLAGNIIGGSKKPPGEGGTPDKILLLQDGTFRDQTEQFDCQGPADAEGWGAGIADINRDGRMDYFIGNDHRTWTLCLSTEDGSFEDVSERVGGGYDFMGFAYGDAGGDGCIDLYGTRVGADALLMHANEDFTPNTYVNAVDPLLDPTSITSGYGVVFADLDNDADQDIVWGAAFEPLSEGVLPGGLAVMKNIAGAEGRLFTDISWAQEAPFGEYLHVYGLVQGDIDRDGQLDIIVGSSGYHRFEMGSSPLTSLVQTVAPLVVHNRTEGGGWLSITLRQGPPNTRAVGATVTVSVNGRVTSRVVSAGSSYLSSVPYQQHFGLAEMSQPEWVTVIWPDGFRQQFTNVAAGEVVLTRTSAGCVPAGTCGDIPATVCIPFDSSALFPLDLCEEMCASVERCDAFESTYEALNCVAACANGDYDREEGYCFLESACDVITDCYVDEILLPFEREAQEFSSGSR